MFGTAPMKLFSCRSSKDLAQMIADKLGIGLGKSSVTNFSDGEFQPCFDESVRGCMVFIVQSTNPPADHLFGSAIFAPYIANLKLKNLTVSAPDMGGSKRANAYSRHLQSEMVLCYKLRKKPNVVEEMSIIGEVEGRNVVIIDDMVDTAGTLALAANMMKDRGATSIRAFATHPILSGNAVERINNSALEELVVSDSVPFTNSSKKIKVLSIADIFAKTIQAVTENQSISTNFVF